MRHAPAVPVRRVPLDDRRRPPDPARPTIHLQAPPNLSDDFGVAARRRHRRLGRRLAGDRRPRQPRAPVARPRPAARGHRGPRLRAGAPADDLPRVRRSTRTAGSTRRCASRCSTAPTPRASAATTRAPTVPEKVSGTRDTGDGAEVDPRRRPLDGVVLGRAGRPAGARAGRPAGVPRRRRRGARRRARRPGARRRRARDAVRRPRPGGRRRRRARRRAARRDRRRHRHLGAQPQHQLHERLHVQVPVLRLLQGPAVAQPARHAVPADARRHRRARRARRGTAAPPR